MALLTRTLTGCRGQAAVFAVVFLCFCATSGAVAETVQLEQKKIEAGLLYNLLKYTDWSRSELSGKKDAPIRICLLGGDSFGSALAPLQGHTAQQHVIDIQEIDTLQQALACSVVFVHRSMQGELEETLKGLGNRSVLTVSNISGFARQGGMVEFSMGADNHMHIYINGNAISRSGLQISEQLARLAKRVDQP